MLPDGCDGEGELLDTCCDEDGSYRVEPVKSALLTPVHEAGNRAVVGFPGVGVADGADEEVDESPVRAVIGGR